MHALLAIGLALTLAQGTVPTTTAPQSELPKYTFSVEIEGRSFGSFRSVSGLSAETEVIEYRDGGDGITHKLPGNTKYSNIKLTRAFSGDRALWEWYTASAGGGHATRVTGSITMLDRSGQPVARYTFVEGWPQKYTGPTLNADGNEVAIESIEIAHEGLQFARPGDTR